MRQGRLKLALEEVLTTQPNPSDPTLLQTPNDHASATTATAPASAQSLSAGPNSQSAPIQPVGNLNASHVPASPAALRISQDAQLELQTAGRRDSTVSSGRLSNASSASGNLLPAPIDLSAAQSAVPPRMGQISSLLCSRGGTAAFNEPQRSACRHALSTLTQLIQTKSP